MLAHETTRHVTAATKLERRRTVTKVFINVNIVSGDWMSNLMSRVSLVTDLDRAPN